MTLELRCFAEQLLFGRSLAEKLYSPDQISDSTPGAALARAPRHPGRPQALEFGRASHRVPLPKLRELDCDQQRGRLLHFFANHELLAIELMALALLRFPEAPARLRRALLGTIREEQKHLQLYQERMQELGVEFGDIPVNAFFWNCLSQMNCLEQYFAGMSLTFEQANLDYAMYYHRWMLDLKDEKTASILQTVLEDEIGHVGLGLTELKRSAGSQGNLFAEQQRWMLPPLTMERAKGLDFSEPEHQRMRRRLGFPADYLTKLISFVGTKGRPVDVYYYNPDCELEWRYGKGYRRGRALDLLIADLSPLMGFLARPGDLVFSGNPPTEVFQQHLRSHGLPAVRHLKLSSTGAARLLPPDILKTQQFCPWGWTSSAQNLAAQLWPQQDPAQIAWQTRQIQLSQAWADKTRIPALRQQVRSALGFSESDFGHLYLDGRIFHSSTKLTAYMHQLWMQDPSQVLVVKAPFGAAGSAMKRFYSDKDISSSQLGWIKACLASQGRLLLEPWLPRQLDLSVLVGPNSDKLQITEFITDARGQYRAHRLGRLGANWPEELRRWFFQSQPGGRSLLSELQCMAKFLVQRIRSEGYTGALGFDAFIAECPVTGSFILRFLSEINCRFTMGHLAVKLQQEVLQPGISGLWRIFALSEMKKLGFESPRKFANWLKYDFMADLAGQWILTNDPEVAVGSLSVLACDEEAAKKLAGIGIETA